MKILSFGTRLVNRLVPSVDAHAICKPFTAVCYCLNHRLYRRFCSYCDGSGGTCGGCVATSTC